MTADIIKVGPARPVRQQRLRHHRPRDAAVDRRRCAVREREDGRDREGHRRADDRRHPPPRRPLGEHRSAEGIPRRARLVPRRRPRALRGEGLRHAGGRRRDHARRVEGARHPHPRAHARQHLPARRWCADVRRHALPRRPRPLRQRCRAAGDDRLDHVAAARRSRTTRRSTPATAPTRPSPNRSASTRSTPRSEHPAGQHGDVTWEG